jgi:hypothetical protein
MHHKRQNGIVFLAALPALLDRNILRSLARSNVSCNSFNSTTGDTLTIKASHLFIISRKFKSATLPGHCRTAKISIQTIRSLDAP